MAESVKFDRWAFTVIGSLVVVGIVATVATSFRLSGDLRAVQVEVQGMRSDLEATNVTVEMVRQEFNALRDRVRDLHSNHDLIRAEVERLGRDLERLERSGD